jgi:hypothetical protein
VRHHAPPHAQVAALTADLAALAAREHSEENPAEALAKAAAKARAPRPAPAALAGRAGESVRGRGKTGPPRGSERPHAPPRQVKHLEATLVSLRKVVKKHEAADADATVLPPVRRALNPCAPRAPVRLGASASASRTDWTRLVPPPVLTGHVSSLRLGASASASCDSAAAA